MDGFTLLNGLENLLSETSDSTWLHPYVAYSFLYKAAIMTVERSQCLTSSQDITTVDGSSKYSLDADFHRLYLMDDQNRYFVKVNDGTNTYFIYWNSYDSVVLGNNTTETAIPTGFSIIDAPALAQKTGTTTSDGILVNPYTIYQQDLGETTLTDTLASFTTVKVGDTVHNTTDGSHGKVIAITSSTAIVCALFYGHNNYFSSGDSYIINPQARFYLVLDPPSSTSGYTVTVPYIQKPDPVFSYYRRYKIQSGYEDALIQYAAWLYKYRDQQPNYGDAWFKYWDATVRQLGKVTNQALGKRDFHVNLSKRAGKSWTYR